MLQRTRGLAALVALIALSGGVPTALVRFVGRPWPSPVPAPAAVWESVRGGDISDGAVIKCLAILVWITWARLTISIVIEVVARARGLRVPHISGLGSAQRWAATLVATAVLLVASVPRPAFASQPSSPAPGGPRPIAAALLQFDANAWATSSSVRADPGSWDTGTNGLLADRAGAASGGPTAFEPVRQPRRGTGSTEHLHTVLRHESFWSIAEDSLGDGARWREIVVLNAGREVAPGVVFDGTPNRLQPGWELLVPAAAGAADRPVGRSTDVSTSTASGSAASAGTHEVVVARGDTLSSIAAAELGDASGWPEIWKLNEGRTLSTGRTFDDPDLILPGWELIVPDAFAPPAAVPAAAPAAVPAVVPMLPSDPGPVPTTVPEAPGSVATTPPPTMPDAELALPDAPATDAPAPPVDITVDVPAVDVPAPDLPAADAPAPVGSVAPAPDGSAAPATVPTIAEPVGLSPAAVDTAGALDAHDDAPPIGGVGGAVLVASGLVGAIAVRRRRRLRGAAVNARLATPSAATVDVDRILRGLDDGERIARLDIALRAAAHELSTGAPGVVVLGVLATADGRLDLLLHGGVPDPPAPWVSVGGHRWRLPADVGLADLAEAARHSQQPCPALAHLGSTPLDGGTSAELFIDLEAAGLLSVAAPRSAADAIVRAIAAGLAVSPMAEIAHIITSGLGDAHLGHPSTRSVPSLSDALDLAVVAVGTTSALTVGTLSTFSLRSRQLPGDAWEPVVVLAGSRSRETDPLADTTVVERVGAGGRALAVVVSGEVAGAPWSIRPDGAQWVLQPLGLEIVPIGLSSADIHQMQLLLDDADAPLVADTEPDGTEPDGIDAAGNDSHLHHDTAGNDSHHDTPGNDSHVHDGNVHDGHHLDHRAPPTVGQPGRRLAVADPPAWSLMVRVLGRPEVIDAGDGSADFERSKALELVVWLTQHRGRSSRSGARTGLWESSVRDTTFANVVSDARRTLARLVAPATGEEWIGRTLTDDLPLHPLVITDADVLADRLRAARGLAPADAIDTLRPALSLVRDIPFAGSGYLWPDTEGVTSELILLVTSAAAVLAGHSLGIGDVAGVFWATGQGLKVLPGHEELISLRMRAYGRTGDLAGVRHEWESYERVLNAEVWSDGEPAPKLVALRKELLTPSLAPAGASL